MPFFLLLSLFFLPCLSGDVSAGRFFFDGGAVYVRTAGAPEPVKINLRVSCIAESGGALYYAGTPGPSDAASWYAGRRTIATGESVEARLPAVPAGAAVRSIAGAGDIVWCVAATASEPSGTLYRLSLADKRVEALGAAHDVCVVSGEVCVLAPAGASAVLRFRGRELPVAIPGPARIREVIDERLVVAGNGAEAEVFDLAAWRSVHLYSSTKRYAPPGEYNLVVRAAVRGGRPDRTGMEFYKIFINGIEAGRTDTALPAAVKSFKTSVRTNEELVVVAERWVLDAGKKKYLRANNVQQPAPQRITVPEKRITVLEISSDGARFEYLVGAVEE